MNFRRSFLVLSLLLIAILAGCGENGPVGNKSAAVTTTREDKITTTTTEKPTTTTTTSTTTTSTTAPTTVLNTTTTTAKPTTTTSSSTTTTTTPVDASNASSESDTPWGWIIAIIAALVAVAAAGYAMMKRDSAAKALANWRASTASQLDAAMMARELLFSDPETAEQREAVNAQAQSAATSLEQRAETAPTAEAKSAAKRTADGLRNVVFAQEANRLLREGGKPPTAQQLGDADATLRARMSELDTAIQDLGVIISPPPPPTSPT